MRAFVTDGRGGGSVAEVPRPVPGVGEIVVRVSFAALNPGDRKLVEGGPASTPAVAGLVAGCDFAGVVDDPHGSSWKRGQRVAGWVVGATDPGVGAYAEFVVVAADLVFAVPDAVSLEQAATLPLAYATATVALYRTLGFPPPYEKASRAPDLLVYGASSSIGQYVVQLARLGGARVVTVASAVHHALLRDLGADEVLDRHDPNWAQRARDGGGERLRHGVDVITDGGSEAVVAGALSHDAQSDLVVVAPVDQAALHRVNPRVRVAPIAAHTVFGRSLRDPLAIAGASAGAGDRAAWVRHLHVLSSMLASGDLVPNPVRPLGGLDDIPAGFDLSRRGGISGRKGVFAIGGPVAAPELP